jgi:diacylglycerol kinase family enzyme
MSQAVIVVNHRAGAGIEQVNALADRLSQRLRSQGQRISSIAIDHRNAKPDRWTLRLSKALSDGGDRVFVLGGDGTVLAVASELLDTRVPLGIIPLGTANLLARDLDIPLRPDEAVDGLANPSATNEADIDVGTVNGQPFLCASMIGLTTALARTREAVRGQNLWQAAARITRKTLRLIWRYPYHRLRITADGKLLQVKTRGLVITNNPIRAIVRPYPTRERLDAGLLGLYGICSGRLWELPRLALRLLQGDWAEDPRIFRLQAHSLRIETRHEHRVTVMNDGERLLLKTPLDYQIRPAALRVLKTQGRNGN